MRWSFLLGSWLLSGCFVPPADCEGQFGVDPSFSEGDVATIRAAAGRYSAWSGDRVTLTGYDTLDHCVIKPGNMPSDDKGLYFHLSGVVLVNFDGESETRRQTIVMHEIGHSFGMEHLGPGRGGVMASPSSGSTISDDFTVDDLDECHRRGHCQRRP